MQNDIILKTTNLALGYEGRPVLDNIDIEMRAGTFTVLIGANGAGKSTLLRTLTGVQPPVSGEVLYCGMNVERMSRRRRAKYISMVSTERNGGGGFTVREAVELGRYPHAGVFERLTGHHKDAVDEALRAVGIEGMAERFLGTLSDGERQKVMIAAALAQETPLIVLDEPTAFLDVAARIEILRVLRRLADAGRAILLSTHDIAPALELADIVWIVDAKASTLRCGAKEKIIGEGLMNLAFPDKNISFDAERGDYC